MILYHFTSADFFKSAIESSNDATVTIDLARLPPLNRGELIFPDFTTTECVWLTSDPEPHTSSPGDVCVRLKLVLPTSDRRLRHYAKWFRRKFGGDFIIDDEIRRETGLSDAEIRRRTSCWWFYLGAIPPERFTDLDLIKDKWPWWLIGRGGGS
jgi:hypothetical protein